MSSQAGPVVRVLLIFSSADIGGAEKSLTRMALANDDPGVGYSLVTLGSGEKWRTWARGQGLGTSAFPVFGDGWPRLSELKRFVAFCRDSRPDVLYVVGMRAAFAVRLVRPLLPRALLVHAIRSSFPRGTSLARRMQLSEFFLRHVTDHYVANSRSGAETLADVIGIDAARITVIHNGVEVDMGHPRAAPRDPGPGIVVVANLNPFKGHLEFLRIIARVRREVPGVHVTFVGRDDLAGAVQREIAAQDLQGVVRLLGYIPDPSDVIADSRLFALPSRTIEGCPTAVMEAMALGKPVVAYRIGGLPELVKSGENGILVEPGDEDAFASALVRLLVDDELTRHLGLAASAAMRDEFSIVESARRHSHLWRSLVQAQPAAVMR